MTGPTLRGVLGTLVKANELGLLHPKSGLWTEAKEVLDWCICGPDASPDGVYPYCRRCVKPCVSLAGEAPADESSAGDA